MKQPRGGTQTPPVFRMIGPEMLLLQMHERARDLDQPFEKGVVRVVRSQPKLFEDVVNLSYRIEF